MNLSNTLNRSAFSFALRQHFLYFDPLPHLHGAFRAVFSISYASAFSFFHTIPLFAIFLSPLHELFTKVFPRRPLTKNIGSHIFAVFGIFERVCLIFIGIYTGYTGNPR
jgi:hypothetical protein